MLSTISPEPITRPLPLELIVTSSNDFPTATMTSPSIRGMATPAIGQFRRAASTDCGRPVSVSCGGAGGEGKACYDNDAISMDAISVASGSTVNGRGSEPVGSLSLQSSPVTTRRRYQWLRKASFLRDELDALGNGLRRVGASLRGSVECIVNNCTSTTPSYSLSSAANKPLQLDQRRIKVELVSSESRNGRRSASCGPRGRGQMMTSHGSDPTSMQYDDDDAGGYSYWAYDLPDHNFTSCLTLSALSDGVFTARLALDLIPRGDITIRVRNYRLEVIVERAEHSNQHCSADKKNGTVVIDDSHRVTRPYYCGCIDIPIYVDTATLQFRSDETGSDALYIKARMKGYVDRRRKNGSFGDGILWSKNGNSDSNLDFRAFDEVTLTSAAVVCGSMAIGHNNWISLFRERANTR